MRIHIRGQMGVQVIGASLALTQVNSDEEPIICVNTKEIPYDGTNKLSNLFDYTCRVIDVDGVRKTPYWIEGAATLIMNNRNKILRWLKPKKSLLRTVSTNAIHIRGDDKTVCSVNSYKHLVSYAKGKTSSIVAYTNDIKFASSIVDDIPVSNNDDLEDWINIYNSEVVYAAPSAFIMCMLILNPNKKIVFLGDKYCDGTYAAIKNDLLFLNELKEFCPNMEILND